MDTRAFGLLRPKTAGRTAVRRISAAFTVIALGVGVSGATAVPSTALTAGTVLVSTTSTVDSGTYEERVQRLVNRRRASHGLRRLRFASCPDRTAESWSRYLAANDLFYHQSMTSVLDTCDATYAGETLGRGAISPRRLVRLWMESSGHRAILLASRPRRIGVGATRNSSGEWVVAANFLRF